MESEKRFNVILLKSNEQPGIGKDKYVDHLTNINTQLKFDLVKQLNLLKFEYCNLSSIRDRLAGVLLTSNTDKVRSYLRTKYRCLIITSRQTIESIEAAFASELASNAITEPQNYNEVKALDDSNKLFIYCVGNSTFARFNEMLVNFKRVNDNIDKQVVVRTIPSEGKQNSLALSRVIIQDSENLLKHDRDDSFKLAFYPCSSIRKDDLGLELTKHGVNFEELTTYRTTHSDTGLDELSELLTKCLANQTINVLVFFSPSGCEAVFEKAHHLNELVKQNLSKIKLVSIGPSTSAKLNLYLPDQFNKFIFELDEPSPQALLDKLNSF